MFFYLFRSRELVDFLARFTIILLEKYNGIPWLIEHKYPLKPGCLHRSRGAASWAWQDYHHITSHTLAPSLILVLRNKYYHHEVHDGSFEFLAHNNLSSVAQARQFLNIILRVKASFWDKSFVFFFLSIRFFF